MRYVAVTMCILKTKPLSCFKADDGHEKADSGRGLILRFKQKLCLAIVKCNDNGHDVFFRLDEIL